MTPVLEQILKSAGENRRLAYGFMLILALSILTGFKAVYKFHMSAQNEIEVKKESLRLISASLDASKEMSKANSSERLHELEKGLIEADKPSIAAAILQRSFKSIASKNNVTVVSERPVKQVEAGAYWRIPVEFQLKTGMSGLKDLLDNLKSSQPMMGVNSLSIKTSEAGLLDVTLVAEGAMKK